MEGSDDAKMGDCQSEESSWTFYIEGFMYDNGDDIEDDDDKNSSAFSQSPSLVSDAASSAVKKLFMKDNCINCREGGSGAGFSPGKTNFPRTMSKQTSFKKKAKVITSMDLELQDTASSPVNSPKVSYMNQFMNQKEKAKMDVSEVKRNSFGKGGFFAVDSYQRDLKKRT